MSTPAAKIGFAVMLLFVVTASVTWSRCWNDATVQADSARIELGADGDCALILAHGGAVRERVAASPVGPRRPSDPVPVPLPRPGPEIPAPRPSDPEPTRLYRVEDGDCLHDIAEKLYGEALRWPEIAKANDLAEPYVIRTGETLKIP